MDATLARRYADWTGQLLASTARWIPDGDPFDVHVHMGVDSGTGEEMTLAAIERQMDEAGAASAMLIPLNASDGYHETCLRLAEIARQSDGRFEALYRVDPARNNLRECVQEGLDAGCSGLKLHPVGDKAHPNDPRLQPALELAAERRAIVLVHAGIDVDGTSKALLDCAIKYPEALFVVGHVAADSLATTAERAADLDNLLMCTAWWGPVDLYYAMQWSDPQRLLFGSDPPYGSIPVGLATTVRAARCAGYDDAQVKLVLAGNTRRALGGAGVPDDRRQEGASDEANLFRRLPVAFQRCYMALLPAAATAERKADPSSHLELAETALEDRLVPGELGPSAAMIRESIKLAADLAKGGEHRHSFIVTAGAMSLAASEPILVEH